MKLTMFLTMFLNVVSFFMFGKRNMQDPLKTIIVDIDGVIADKDHGGVYADAGPLNYGISQVNALYELGYYIILFTARYGLREHGCVARQYERGFTELIEWLDKHGVKRNETRMGKPPGVMYIDDKATRVHGDSGSGWSDVWSEVENLKGKDKYGRLDTKTKKA